MASLDMNATLHRFEQGGFITITTATDTLTLYNVVPGSVAWVTPTPTRMNYGDRGLVKVPLEGNNKPGRLSFQCRCGRQLAGLIEKLKGRNSAGNTAKTFTAVLTIPNYVGATAGETLTYSSGTIWLEEDVEVQTGGDGDFDIASFTFGTIGEPTPASY